VVPLRWDPLTGCTDPETALRRGAAWAAAQPLDNVRNGDWFNKRAAEMLSRLLHAAALSSAAGWRRTILDVYRWTQDFGDIEPRAILATDGPPGWDDYLQALADNRAGETMDSLKMSLAGVLGSLASPRVMATLTPPPGEQFDVEDFLSRPGTLYLLAGERGGTIIAPVFTMLLDELITTAGTLSQTHPEEFLWPPFRAVLDEAANLAPIPHLAAHMSDSGGRGVQLIPIVQSLAQTRQRWGPDAADAIAATATLYLPGCREEAVTRTLTRLAGKRRVPRTTTSRGRGQHSTTLATELEDVLPEHHVPRLSEGQAWMLYRNLPLARIQLTPWHDHP
jgi:hypothetical protein